MSSNTPIPIKAEDFIKAVRSGIADNYKVIGDVVFDKNNFSTNILVVKNTVFDGRVIFNEIDIETSLTFINCNSQNGLYFNKCNLSNSTLNDKNIHLNECKFYEFRIIESSLESGLTISNESSLDELKIQGVEVRRGNIHISDTTIRKTFEISHLTISQATSLSLQKCIIKSEFKLLASQPSSLRIYDNCEFEKEINIQGCIFHNDIEIINGQFNEDLSAFGNQIFGSLVVRGGTFNKSLIVSNSKLLYDFKGSLHKIILEGGEFKTAFTINGHEELVKEIYIFCSENLTGTVEHKKLKINKIKVTGDNHKGNLIFNQCDFGFIEFDHFYNYNNLALTTCKALPDTNNSTLAIKNSNLGKTQLFNVNHNTFNSIEIQDSFMGDIIVSGVEWFIDEKLNQSTRNEPHKLREIYRQLKYAQEKQGNHIQALDFKAMELYHFKTEFSEKGFWNKNRLILWSSQTNNFGTDWWKPVVWLFWITIIFYILIAELIHFKDLKQITCLCTDINLLLKPLLDEIKFLPELFSPIRTWSKNYPNGLIGFLVSTLDVFHRIVLAFFIFQIISAFRKYYKA
jgi:hypothetical protein